MTDEQWEWILVLIRTEEGRKKVVKALIDNMKALGKL